MGAWSLVEPALGCFGTTWEIILAIGRIELIDQPEDGID
jgi:hypothetical protein